MIAKVKWEDLEPPAPWQPVSEKVSWGIQWNARRPEYFGNFKTKRALMKALWIARREDTLHGLRELVHTLSEDAANRGWFDHPMPYLVLALTARVQEEIAELVEVFARAKDREPSDKIPEYTKAEEEWADVVLKTLRIGGALGFRVGAILAKLEHNVQRADKRGGKLF